MATSTLYGGNFGFPGADTDPTYASTWESTQGQNPALLGGISLYGMPISTWPGYIASALQNQLASSNGGERTAIPSLSVGMNDGSTSADQFFKNISSGQYDSEYTGILQSVKSAGFNEVYLRPGWEFNGNWMDWYPGSNTGDFVSAFQHLYTLWHNWAAANGLKVVVDWNPAQGGDDPTAAYPGDNYVDNITFDSYGAAATGHPDSEATNPNILSIQTMAEFAAQHGKPFGLDEVGAGNTDTQYPALVAQAITNAANAFPGQLTVDHIITWDRNDGGTVGNLYWSGTAATAAAWKQAEATIASVSAGGTVNPPPPPPPPPGGTPSPDGTKITSASDPEIIDQSGNAWSLVQAADQTQGLQIAINGAVDAITHNVVLLETLNGAMVQENSDGNWYSETQPNDSWVQISDPTQASPPPPPPTTSPSPNGTTITQASDPPIIDQSGNSWSLVQSATQGLQIAVNGAVDAITHQVVLLETLNGSMVQENNEGKWYSESQPNDSWVQISAPSGSGGTSNPPIQNGVMTLSASDTSNTVPDSNISIVATTGDHMLFLGGSNDTVNLTGGTENVTTQSGGSNNNITIGAGDDTVTLGSSGNSVTAGSGINEITDNAGSNTFVLPAAGQGLDDLFGNILSNGDNLDLRPALSGTNWNGSTSSIGNFVRVAMEGNDAIVMVSKRSHGAGTMIADLHGAGSTNLQGLLAHSIT